MEATHEGRGVTVYEDGDARLKQFNTEPEYAEMEEREDGFQYLTVPINSRYVEREGDEFTDSGLQAQVEQLKEGTVKFYFDHGMDENGMPSYKTLDQAGVFVDGEIRDKNGEDTVFGTIKLRKDYEPNEELVSLIQQGMAVSFSVGFRILEFEEMTDEDGYVTGLRIMDVDLMETSAVGIPANATAVVTASKVMNAFQERGIELSNDKIDQLTASLEKLNDATGEQNMPDNENEGEPEVEPEEGQEEDVEDSSDGEGDGEAEQQFSLEAVEETVEQAVENVLDEKLETKIEEALDTKFSELEESLKSVQEGDKDEDDEEEDDEEENSEQRNSGKPEGRRMQTADNEETQSEGDEDEESQSEEVNQGKEPEGFSPKF